MIPHWGELARRRGGHLPNEDEGYLMEFLEDLGGDVTCDAKLTKLVHGGYDLHLDIARPPTLID